MRTLTLQTAIDLRAAGVACIPVGADKRPLISSWKKFMTELPTEAQLEKWFSADAGIALVAGDVQCIDVDEKYQAGLMVEFERSVRNLGLGGVWDRCLIQSTPSGGYHVVFRSEGEPIRNLKLASKENREVLIETRGAGGYFLIEPSEGYAVQQGDFEMLPVLTEEERADLMDVARSFNRKAPRDESKPASTAGELSPGDDYDLRGDFRGLMESHGWVWTDDKHLRRPGKDRGISGSFGVIPNRFWVFSTSTEFENEKLYKPYMVYAMLEHGGDVKRAIGELARQGYGAKRERKEVVGSAEALPEVADATPEVAQEKPEFEIKRFIELERSSEDDPNNILGDRFLCRGACAMLFGYSGVGKSSLETQLSHMWALGKTCLGIRPSRPLNILIIQAENDDGDLAEMRDGVAEGMIEAGLMTAKQAQCAQKFVWTIRVSSKCGAQVGPLLEQYGPGFDLVMLDPLFAYLGGDSADQKDVSYFLRNVIDPVITRLNIALLILHHTNKPPKDGKHDSSVADMAYLSAGSAELTNYPRGILAVLPTQRSDVFRLVAAKRGDRLGWGKDASGKPRRTKMIAHSDGYICWRELDDVEAAQVMEESGEKKSKGPGQEERIDMAASHVRTLLADDVWEVGELHNRIEAKFKLGRNARTAAIRDAGQSVPGVDRVQPKAGKTAPWLIGPMQKVAERRVKMEQEYEAKKQQELTQ